MVAKHPGGKGARCVLVTFVGLSYVSHGHTEYLMNDAKGSHGLGADALITTIRWSSCPALRMERLLRIA